MNNNYDQQFQYEYEDGNRQVRTQYLQQSWASQGHTISGPLPMPTFPQPIAAPMQSMHQQMHQAAMAHHQSVAQQFNNMHVSMSSMFQPMQPLQPNMISPPVQQMQLPPPPVRLAIGPVVEELETSSEEESESEDDDDGSEDAALEQLKILQHHHDAREQAMSARVAADRLRQDAERVAIQKRLEDEKQKHEAQRQALEQRYAADQQNIHRQGAIMDTRLRMLEEVETKNRAEREAKDREMQQLREENNRINQQRHEDAEKHRREMVELARSRAESLHQPASAFDSSALERVIREMQAQQLTKADIEKVIQERVASQLSGLARQKDLDAAGSRMQRALEKVPKGASSEQIQQALNHELNKAIDKLASKVQQHQPLGENSNATQTPMLLPSTGSQPVPMPPVSISSTTSTRARPGLDSTALVKTSRDKKTRLSTSKQLPQAIEPAIDHKSAEPANQIPVLALTKVKKEKKRSTITLDAQPSNLPLLSEPERPISNQQVHDDTSLTPAHKDEHALTKTKKDKKKLKSTAAETPPLINGLIRVSPMQPHSEVLQATATVLPTAVLPDDFPDNASQITTWERKKSSKASSKSLLPIDESLPDNAVTQKSKHGHRSSSAVASPSTNALVRGSKKDKAPKAPTANAVTIMDVPVPMTSFPLPEMPAGLQLPDDFPDNASQISTWERSRASHAPPALTGVSALAQIQDSSCGGSSSQVLTKSSKPKKHSTR